MGELIEIGMGKAARRGYHLRQVAIMPSRRTRDIDEVATAWQLDAFTFDIPMMAHPSDATVSPETAVRLGQLGGLGVLNAEGLWTRYVEPLPMLAKLAAAPDSERTALAQQIYAEPIKPELIAERIAQMQSIADTVAFQGAASNAAARIPIAVRVSPQHTLEYAPVVVAAGVDVLVIQGTIVSAEHVCGAANPLDLKEFIGELEVPVVVGGCANYQTALHLMRTGAAGVIVGMGADAWTTSDDVLGIRIPMATAIADAAAARRDYLDETGGRYVHVVADGDLHTSGDIGRAIACGADAVMLGEPLAVAAEVPGHGAWWHPAATHPKLPRGMIADAVPRWPRADLATVLHGPSDEAGGTLNLFGGLRRMMAKAGYRDVKAFQKVELVLDI